MSSSADNQSAVNKKNASPKLVKRISQNLTKDFVLKVNEAPQKQVVTFGDGLMPVNQVVFDVDMKSIFENVRQDVEMIDTDKSSTKPKTETSEGDKVNVPVSPRTDNNSSSLPQQTPKEGNVKSRTSTSVSARRSKKQRELEATLAALKPESLQVKRERAMTYAQTYLMKVKERLTDAPYAEFIQELVKFKEAKSTDAASLYRKMETQLRPHKDLIDEFLAFLLPHQAKQVDRLMDYLLLVKMRQFMNKLEVLMVKQSQQVYASLEQLASQPNVTLTDVHNAILPHLKSSPLLTDYFLQLLPGERPPDSMMIDYEQADCIADDEEPGYEMVHVPDDDDPYGGEHCPCRCHETERFHCVKCGIKYINGKVYLQHGKFIRPAEVVFEKEDQKKMFELKWRRQGDPEINYNRYHHRRYFPSPAKVSDHNRGTKRSPRTPKVKPCVPIKAKSLKTAPTRGNCSKKLPMIEGIVPLVNKVVSIENNQNKDVKRPRVSEDREAKEVLSMEESDNAIQEETEVIHSRDESKSPTFSQIADIPSVLSPMSFYNESLQSRPDIELHNDTITKCENSPHVDWKFTLESIRNTNKAPEDLIVLEKECNTKYDGNEKSLILDSVKMEQENTDKKENDECIQSINKSIMLINDIITETPELVDADKEHKETPQIDLQKNTENERISDLDSEKKEHVENTIENEQSCAPGELDIKDKNDLKENKISCDQIEECVEQKKINVDSKGSQSSEVCWTRDEDKIILQVLQQEGDTEQTFVKINQLLPSRTVTEIQNRFKVLLQLLQQMTGVGDDNQI